MPLYRNKDTGIVSWGPLLRANADKFAVCRTDVDLKVGFCAHRKVAVFPALPLSVLVSVSVWCLTHKFLSVYRTSGGT